MAMRTKRRVDGGRLGELMEERFVDRGELAEMSGVSYSTLYKMERRNYMPTVRKLKVVARALGVGPEELVTSPEEGDVPA